MVTYIDSASVHQRLHPQAAVKAIERAFAALGRGSIGPSQSLGVNAADGSFHVKTCASMGAGALFVAKVNANFPANPTARGLPTIQGVIAVFDTLDGRVLALVDSASVTSLRTAATTMLAVKLLAREGATAATIVGCGALGSAHAQALRATTGLTELFLYDEDRERSAAVAAAVPGARVAHCLRDATLASDVVITCTPSTTPFLGPGDVRPGTLVAAVGSDNDRKLEIQPGLLAAARIVADSTAQCEKMGELKQARNGPWPVAGELVAVVAGEVGRTRPDEVVVFDSTGMAIEDLALCAALLDRDLAR